MYVWAIIRAILLIAVFGRNFNPTMVPYNSLANGMHYLRLHDLAVYLEFLGLALSMVGINLLLWKTVKEVLEKIKLDSPFTIAVSAKITRIGYLLLGGWLISLIAEIDLNEIRGIKGIERVLNDYVGFDADITYLLCAGIVYTIAQIFKRGVELQQENELTI